MTHASVAGSPLAVPGGLVRLSVGIEAADDLRADLEAAFTASGLVTDDPRDQDGPTEVVETDDGELIERLSGGTATLLLIWLIGIGALSTLLAAWLFIWIVTGERLGIGALFSGFGFYTSLAGAAGPCVLWLTGRAQGHSLGWFSITAVKIALVMVAVILAFVLLAALVMTGADPRGTGVLAAIGLMVLMAIVLALIWAVATWAADRWIARARLPPPPVQISYVGPGSAISTSPPNASAAWFGTSRRRPPADGSAPGVPRRRRAPSPASEGRRWPRGSGGVRVLVERSKRGLAQ